MDERAQRRAGVAQLVEHDVANVVVVGSNPITRSRFFQGLRVQAPTGHRFTRPAPRSSSIASTATHMAQDELDDTEAVEDAPEGEVYWLDLIGSAVVDPLGEKLGIIDTLMQTGANDVLVVKTGTEEILIPFVADVIVKVDRHAKTVTVNWGKDWHKD